MFDDNEEFYQEYWHVKESGEIFPTPWKLDAEGDHGFLIVNCPSRDVAKECWHALWVAKLSSSFES